MVVVTISDKELLEFIAERKGLIFDNLLKKSFNKDGDLELLVKNKNGL